MATEPGFKIEIQYLAWPGYRLTENYVQWLTRPVVATEPGFRREPQRLTRPVVATEPESLVSKENYSSWHDQGRQLNLGSLVSKGNYSDDTARGGNWLNLGTQVPKENYSSWHNQEWQLSLVSTENYSSWHDQGWQLNEYGSLVSKGNLSGWHDQDGNWAWESGFKRELRQLIDTTRGSRG